MPNRYAFVLSPHPPLRRRQRAFLARAVGEVDVSEFDIDFYNKADPFSVRVPVTPGTTSEYLGEVLDKFRRIR